MKFPRRYTLSALLVATLIAAVTLGYVQWRRAAVVKSIQQSHREWTVRAELRGNWFWPEVRAIIVMPRDVSYSDDRFVAFISELKQLGADKVQVDTKGQ
jgi:hypothetical protein